jgi:hypothetical protein
MRNDNRSAHFWIKIYVIINLIICDDMNETVKYNKIREMDNYLVLSLKNKNRYGMTLTIKGSKIMEQH